MIDSLLTFRHLRWINHALYLFTVLTLCFLPSATKEIEKLFRFPEPKVTSSKCFDSPTNSTKLKYTLFKHPTPHQSLKQTLTPNHRGHSYRTHFVKEKLTLRKTTGVTFSPFSQNISLSIPVVHSLGTRDR